MRVRIYSITLLIVEASVLSWPDCDFSPDSASGSVFDCASTSGITSAGGLESALEFPSDSA